MKASKLGAWCAIILVLSALMAACKPTVTSSPTTPSVSTQSAASKTATSPSPSPTSKPTSASAPVSFAGKTITLVVAYEAGGATDILARIYGRFLSKYLPGRPATIVRNMPGGAGTIGTNYVYFAKPDGLTGLVMASSATINQLLGMKAVKYDFAKMPAAVGVATVYAAFMKAGIISKPEDIRSARGVIVGASAGSGAYFFIAAKELLGIPADRLVLAYAGAAGALRAFMAGEVNFSVTSGTSFNENILPLTERREAMALFQTGVFDSKGNMVRDPSLPPDLPTLKELYEKVNGNPPSGKDWDAFKVLAAGLNYDKVLLLPPGADQAARAYWEASEQMIKDPDFLKAVQSFVGKDASWGAGEAYQKGFWQNIAMEPAILEHLRSMLLKYGMVIE